MLRMIYVLAFSLGICNAQPMLTVHQAKALVENAPDVVKDRLAGFCPVVSINASYASSVDLSARRMCKDKSASGLIGQFSVDLKSGQVTAMGSGAIDSERLVSLRRELFKQRVDRRLTKNEASCLAKNIPDVLSWRTRGLEPEVRFVNDTSPSDDSFRLIVYAMEPKTKFAETFFLRVNKDSYKITDTNTGEVIDSPRLFDLRGDPFDRRSPEVQLNRVEAKAILTNTAPFLEAATKGLCPALVEHTQLSGSQEMWVAVVVACDSQHPTGKTLAEFLVNTANGEVRIPGSSQAIESEALRAARNNAIKAARDRKRIAESALQRACRF